MTNQEIEMIRSIDELQELKRMREELDAAIDAAQDKVKAAMGDNETATYGPYKVTYKTVTTTRLDTTGIRKALPADMLAPFLKTSESRPLRIT